MVRMSRLQCWRPGPGFITRPSWGINFSNTTIGRSVRREISQTLCRCTSACDCYTSKAWLVLHRLRWCNELHSGNSKKLCVIRTCLVFRTIHIDINHVKIQKVKVTWTSRFVQRFCGKLKRQKFHGPFFFLRVFRKNTVRCWRFTRGWHFSGTTRDSCGTRQTTLTSRRCTRRTRNSGCRTSVCIISTTLLCWMTSGAEILLPQWTAVHETTSNVVMTVVHWLIHCLLIPD